MLIWTGGTEGNINRTVYALKYCLPLSWCIMVQAVLRYRSVDCFDLVIFRPIDALVYRSASSVFLMLYIYLIFVTFFTLSVNDLSLVGLVHDLVDYLLVGSSAQ